MLFRVTFDYNNQDYDFAYEGFNSINEMLEFICMEMKIELWEMKNKKLYKYKY